MPCSIHIVFQKLKNKYWYFDFKFTIVKMKLEEIKPLNEYYIGHLQAMPVSQVMSFLEDAVQEKHHIVIKDGGPTAFIFRYDFDSKTFLYILVDHQSKNYIGHCTISKINKNVLQPIDINILSEFRGFQLAPRLYSFITKSLDCYIINGKQLSASADKMWNKLSGKKIYNLEEDEFYELTETNKDFPKNDRDHESQTWFFAWKETRNILESYKYLGENFDYDAFLNGKPSLLLGTTKINFIPMSPTLE
jgi:hypothetical protein